jgi:type I restriction enzyme, S subunit
VTHKRYEKYIDTEEAWLGSHPSHWARKPLWTLFRRVKRQGFESEELLSVYRDHGVIPKSSREDNFNKPSDDLSAYQLVEPGDLAVNKMKAWQGSVAISKHRGIVSPAYHVYTSLHSENQRYLHYLMRCDRYITGYLAISKGIRVNQWDLQPEYHSRMPVLLPPLNEQLGIASFLDRETAKIDALITEQQRLIELLQEKRQAVISHAVTKGLNPNAPMKDSGVEWLGEVPEHWEILPIWILFQLGRGRVISHEDIAQNPGDYPVYSSQTEDNGEMGRIGTFDFEGEYLTWTTDGANAGSVFRREGRFNCTNVCGTLKAKSSTHINLDFALASLRLATRAFVRMDINPKLMNNVMASIRVPVPPMGEQVEIIRKLDKQIRGFQPLEDSIEVQVCLLKERRSALISAAVTGQIDVRGLVETEAGKQ